MLPIDQKLTKEQTRKARDDFAAYLKRKDLSLKLVSRQTARAHRSIEDWMQGRFFGDADKMTRTLVAWMEQHARGESSGMPQGFISTSVTTKMYAVLREVVRTRTCGLITGPAGVSKTIMCQAAEAGLIPGSLHVECFQGCHAPRSFAEHWARRLGCRTSGSLGQIQMAMVNELRGSDRLQMIDEAHYLSPHALNIVRDTHKLASVPIVLVGTRDVEDATNDRKQWYGQWTRLISHRYDILEGQEADGDPLFTIEEIHRFAASMQIKLTGDGAESATEIACMPGLIGGLGALAMILLNAKRLCDADGRRSVNAADIIGAYQATQGARWVRHLENTRKALTEKVKVA